MAPQTAAESLASYAASLRYGDIPDDVRRRARDCVIDTVAACVFGHRAPAGRIVARHVAGRSSGACHVLGSGGAPMQAEDAALANGTLAHALELDSLRKPGAGVHPGAVLLSAGLAVAQERQLGGEALLAAIVAGCEVLFRIGKSTRHSIETRGFHAPGITGPFGAAVTAGHLLGLDAARMTQALGIAGSLGGGLLQFAAQGEGGMVKRLHLGHAAASGIAAAKLARDGFTGPSGVLEGEMGFLHAYSAESDPAALTAGLGESYETLKICFKRYPCHITAHAPVQSVVDLQAEHSFAGADVAEVVVDGSKKMAELHANQSPADNVAAQYSIAFCVAAALLHDPKQPETFTGRALADQTVLALCRRVRVTGEGGFASSWTTRTTVKLQDGRAFSRTLDDVPGMPGLPFDSDQLRAKFLSLTATLGDQAPGLLARLERIETEPQLDWLDARPNGNAHGIA
jgi:2-methylcitrate dehydratase PrpD